MSRFDKFVDAFLEKVELAHIPNNQVRRIEGNEMSETPVYGCPGCSTTAGASGCPLHRVMLTGATNIGDAWTRLISAEAERDQLRSMFEWLAEGARVTERKSGKEMGWFAFEDGDLMYAERDETFCHASPQEAIKAAMARRTR